LRERSTTLSAPRLELAYGPDERNEIDFFPALNAPPDAPILIAIHGGLWFLFDKWMMHFLVPAFTAAGVHVAFPNYRLAPAAGLGDIVGDCRRAVAFVHENRDATGADTGGMYVLGHSAAGQLAAAMASTNWREFDPRLPADMLDGFIGVSGFYDIEPFAGTGFQQQTKFAISDYKTWNPVNLIHAGMPPGPSDHRGERVRPLARNDGWLCRHAVRRRHQCRDDRRARRGPLFRPGAAGRRGVRVARAGAGVDALAGPGKASFAQNQSAGRKPLGALFEGDHHPRWHPQ
jgi:acetyl esterase/lipase